MFFKKELFVQVSKLEAAKGVNNKMFGIAGVFNEPSARVTFLVIKLKPYLYNGAGNGNDRTSSIASDNAGALYAGNFFAAFS